MFESYIKKGLVKKQRPNWKQIQDQIRLAKKDLKTAEPVLRIDASWSATMVYQALLRAGRALLMSRGVLPADGGQHKTVVELTGKILGREFSDSINAFEKMRKKRNQFFYESVQSTTRTEAKNAFKITKVIIGKIEEILQDENPQLKFNMK
jgi:uncharacterized protein (UPF0332 family)